MSIRTTVTSGSWQNLGAGPATIQVISPDSNGATVMVYVGASPPGTNLDGLAMGCQLPVWSTDATGNIYAQVLQAGLTAVVAVQPGST